MQRPKNICMLDKYAEIYKTIHHLQSVCFENMYTYIHMVHMKINSIHVCTRTTH